MVIRLDFNLCQGTPVKIDKLRFFKCFEILEEIYKQYPCVLGQHYGLSLKSLHALAELSPLPGEQA